MKVELKITGFALCCLLFSPVNVYAADWQKEINDLREDVLVLQRQMYRNSSGIGSENADVKKTSDDVQKGDMQVKMSEYDEIIRKINGRMDTLEHDLKQTEQKIDKINRDMEIRFKILEGRQVPANLSAPASTSGGVTHSSPIAQNPAKSAFGDSISGSDLEPLSGMQAIPQKQENEPQPLVPISDINIQSSDMPKVSETKSISVDEMYNSGLQAYNAGLTDEAEVAFKEILKKDPKHRLAGNAQYWLGETYLKAGELTKAKQAFKSGYEDYKNGNKSADSLFKLGMTFSKLNDSKSACIIYMSFDSEFPKADANLIKRVKTEKEKLKCK